MDFGKISPRKKRASMNAKKAMKLMWSEGITLKEAWKKVLSGKRAMSPKRKRVMSPKRKRAMSPKRKRAIANSKKAMNIMWKQGISLKKAWSKVNRFGDTVCPQGYEPNPTWNADNIKRQQCIKICQPGYVRNPITNRCIKMAGASPPREILPGYEINPATGRTRRTQSASSSQEVLPGYEINPATGRTRRVCQPGQVRNPITNRCINSATREVLPGYEINPATGRTRRIQSASSSQEVLPGYEINPATGRTRRIQSVSSSQEVLPGYEINPATGRTRRVCPPGTYRDPVSSRCIKLSSFSIEPLIAPPYIPPLRGEYVPPVVPNYSMFGRKRAFGQRCGFGSCASCNSK